MKKKVIAMTTAIMLLSSPAFAETIHIGVDGLICAFCAKGLEKNFNAQPQTQTIDVDLDKGLVTVVTKKDATIDDAVITKIITDSGFKLTNIHRMK